MGSWDVLAASGEGNVGTHIFEDADGCLVRAPDGMLVAALGVRNLAIVVETDAVLICDLNRSQDVKKLIDRVRASSPGHLDFQIASPESLARGATRLAAWLRLRCLPLWSTAGLQDETGFEEVLGLDGRRLPTSSRSLVQARQTYVFAQAGRLGWTGPWNHAVRTGLETLSRRFTRTDGAIRARLTPDGAVLDDTARLYDQSFVMLALAAARSAGDDRTELLEQARSIRDRIGSGRWNGGFLEVGGHPYQANAQMHLLEAAMAWEAIDDDPAWSSLSDQIVTLAVTRFIDPKTSALREFFNADWSPAEGKDGTLVEPGHQFEWAWLLTRRHLMRQDAEALSIARHLYAVGRSGVAELSGVAQDAMNIDGTLRSGRARLWPQTEWLKASLLLAEQSADGERAALLADAEQAMKALWLYLTSDGVWHDKRLVDGGFVEEAAPASSLYHIMAAFDQLARSCGSLGIENASQLDLA